ncbi:MAG: pyrroline-5-carboxylate reductase [Pseudomonadota bacterium]
MDFTVVLVGVGNMGGAMLRGWLANGLVPENITVIDPGPSEVMQTFLNKAGVKHSPDEKNIPSPDVLILAVKPQMMETVLPTLGGLAGPDTVVVSVAAGTTILGIKSHLKNATIVRSMPNTPSLVNRGMTVACPEAGVSDLQRDQVEKLLSAIGKFAWVEEEPLIDAVTAVSGSGPAYVFHLAECMAQAGIAAGLPEDLAMMLARETVAGAGELLFQSDEEPAQLRINVTSPNGTTAAALDVLMDDAALRKLVEAAVRAAKRRSEELAQ